ncbi:phenazine biosynthesis-like domain-containing protein 1 [Denticeps clupeoides]|uniref:Phenazine biosynthesis-like domain-containing protein n=1 Tax=Denticeps clupeoides TaxID=299321 RepID=A0AAY4E522_9TELE|nr:phenazine biosynthesis-like domain-containing protein [Denticeps clupeoides]
MDIPIFIVDAFTSSPFKGNPAAVCLLPSPLQDDLYQKIAAEMNLSETAFVICLQSSLSAGTHFALRWFTPINEIVLCGHATLASAAVLFYHKKNPNPAVVFQTLSGDLCVRQNGESLVMDFPLNKPIAQDQREFAELCKAALGDLPVEDVCYCAKTKNLLVHLDDTCDRSVLTSIRPDPEKMLHCDSSGNIKGIVVTIKGDRTSPPTYDFFSRYFAPWHGVTEDPVTGSTHTILAAYWSKKLGKQKMLAYQCSKRGGELEVEIKGDRVDITGQAVIVLQGTLLL